MIETVTRYVGYVIMLFDVIWLGNVTAWWNDSLKSVS